MKFINILLFFVFFSFIIFIYIFHSSLNNENLRNSKNSSKLSNIQNIEINTNITKLDHICLFHSNSNDYKYLYNLITFISINNKINYFCNDIYIICKAIGDVTNDLLFSNIKIIRYIYPKPIEFLLLLPLYIDKNNIILIELINDNLDKFEIDFNKFILENNKIYFGEITKFYYLNTDNLRYIWVYYGPLFVKENIEYIMKDPYSLSILFKKVKPNKDIGYRKCLKPNTNNEDFSLVLRLRKRSNNYLVQMNNFTVWNNLSVIMHAQNDLFHDFRSYFNLYPKRITNYLFWCTNWNSVYYLFRLLPFLIDSRYTFFLDDDELVTPSFIDVSKEIVKRENGMVSTIGLHPNGTKNVIINNENILLCKCEFLFSFQFASTEWYTIPFRFKIPYKLWGDDVMFSRVSRIECNIESFILSFQKFRIGLDKSNSFKSTNRTLYNDGPPILDPYTKECSKPLSIVNVSLCYYSIPNF